MRKTVSDRQIELISSLKAARQALLDSAAPLPPEAQDEPCIGSWDVKDLLAHCIGWDATNRQAIQEILSGQRPTFFRYYDSDWHSYNAKLVARYRQEDLQALIQQCQESHRQLVEWLAELSPAQLLEAKSPREQGRPVTIRTLLRAQAQDEMRHADQLRAFVEQRSPAKRV